VRVSLTPEQWAGLIEARQGHVLQSWAWGELKSRFGWTARRVQGDEAAAQILFRRLPLGLTIAYIPRGPMVDWANPAQCRALFSIIHAEARQRRAIFLKVEPDLDTLWDADHGQVGPAHGSDPPSSHETALDFLAAAGFIPADTIQPRTSLIIDLSQDEAAVLAAMKQKTRYNIRLAEKRGVTVRQGSAADVATFHALARTTAQRNEFGVHSLAYYQTAYDLFAPDRCALLIAEVEGEPLAALMVFGQGQTAYYFYGASSNRQRQLMAPYLVQWAAIRWAQSRGSCCYDLWGIPDADPASLETGFEQRQDGLWGVYRFKRGFGGRYVRSIGAFDYVYQPLLYPVYKLYRKRLTG
jgi:lipid II:glycine glycyltransferase (peptidoglycan interpeptide bridge formation enzyme)